MRERKILQGILVVVGSVLIALALGVAYVHDTVSDSDEFAARASKAYADPLVLHRMSDQIVDQLVAAEPELVAVEPVLETVIEGVLGTPTAAEIVQAGLADLHRTVFSDDEDTVIIELADLVVVAKTQLSALDPETGALIPDDLTDAIIDLQTDPAVVDVIQTVDELERWSRLLPVLALAALAGAAWMASSGAEGAMRTGVGLIGGGALAILVAQIARMLVVRSDGGNDETAAVIWDAFADDFTVWALSVVGIGAVIAAVAWFGVGEQTPAHRLRAVADLAPRSGTRGRRILWGIGAVAVGGYLIAEWQTAVRFSVTVLGAALMAVGARELLVVLAPQLARGMSRTRADRGRETEGGDLDRPNRNRWITAALVMGLGVLGLVAMWRAGDTDGEIDLTCNGADTVCDRRVDQVVFAGTHNSHAAANEGFAFGYQREGIASQLGSGVRALLVDVYFGWEDAGAVITDRTAQTDEERQEAIAQVGAAAVRSAEATAARFDSAGKQRELFLCHALCEVGASRLVDELRAVRDFLDANPRNVIIMVVQDEGPRPPDIANAFEQAGLTDRLHAQDRDQPWPTLEELIDARRQIVVFAENEAGELDWYHDAFAYLQDTPFTFETADDFSCELNRGEPDNPLFLVNHWLSPASPVSAGEVNTAEVLSRRFEECRQERGQLPNILAVDFHEQGKLVDTVRVLNERVDAES